MSRFDKAIGTRTIKKAAAVNRNEANIPKIELIDISLLDENPDNENVFNMDGMEQLKRSINENGFTVPVEVFKKPDGRYEISSGHRRVRAMKELGKDRVPCIVNSMPNDIVRAKRLLDSNITNRDMKPMDYARAIEYYVDYVLKPSGFAGRINDACADYFGISSSAVYKYRSLSKIDSSLQELADDERIPFTSLVSAHRLSPGMQERLASELKKMLSKDGDGDGPSRDRIMSLIRNLLKEEDRYRGANDRAKRKKAPDNIPVSDDEQQDSPVPDKSGTVPSAKGDNRAEEYIRHSYPADDRSVPIPDDDETRASAGQDTELYEETAGADVEPTRNDSGSVPAVPAGMALQKMDMLDSIITELEDYLSIDPSPEAYKRLERAGERIADILKKF